MQTQEIKNILQSTYRTNDWLAILNYLAANKSSRLRDTNNHTDLTEKLSATERKTFENLKRIGTFITSEGEKMPIFEVLLQSNVRIDRNRVQVNEIIKKQIIRDEIKAALCVFLYDKPTEKEWRFSFISKFSASDFLLEAEEKETNPKRYTYIFGTQEQHLTAIQRFQSLRESNFTIDDFFEAFAIEALSKAFFKEYRDEHYQKFVDYLNTLSSTSTFFIHNKDGKEVRDFVKKTLGRIVFLYFVQKKGWLGASDLDYEDGDLNFMENYFKAAGADKGFYPNYLTKLFFETLNAQREDDDFEMPNGEMVKIPYLNGGLFENENELYNSLTFKPILFQNLFDFLNSYNFTVYENSPDDHVVAVDPEMLGNIFENLLEDNRDKGAFYTPKEIVQYMCQQSIIEYLATKTKAEYSTIAAFVKAKNISTAKAIEAEAKVINTALDEVKICDPAIGSGAFPMGLLQEVFDLKVALHQLLKIEIVKENKNFDDMFAEVKANIIQNSIYGVDIEKGAVDIARLRFWLSLVVDEKTPKALPNLDYKIMQGNSLLESFEGFDLSFDFYQAQRTGLETFSLSDVKNIKKLIDKYFSLGKAKNQSTISISEQKKEIKAEIENLVIEVIEEKIDEKRRRLKQSITDITKHLAQLSRTLDKSTTAEQRRKKEVAIEQNKLELVATSKKLEDLERRAKNLKKAHLKKERPYFLWSVYFYDVFENGGFDILIGNPPYIQLQRDGGFLANLYKHEDFETFTRSGDIYGLFYEKGFDLLKDNGVHTFITSNKWMRANYGKPLRKYLANQNAIRLLDLGPGVFPNATVDTNILIAKKGKNQQQLQSIIIDKRQDLDSLDDSEFVKMPNVNEDIWTVISAAELKIKTQIEKIGTPLKDWDIEIYRGILTGYNNAFIISTEKRNELIAANPKSAEIIKPILRGRDIQKYRAEWADLWLINTHNGVKNKDKYTKKTQPYIIEPISINDYPIIKNHLDEYWGRLKKRGDKGNTPYNLRNCAYLEAFDKEKIVYNDISKRELTFSFDKSGIYLNNTIYFIYGKSNLKYLVSVLNSKSIDWYYRQISSQLGASSVRLFSIFMEKLPIPKIEKSKQKIFETLVDYILHLHETEEQIDEYVPNNHIITEIEKVINGCVYELYFKESIEKAGAAVLDLAMELFKPLPTDADVKTKNEIIAKAFLTLQESKNPIRNRLILQNILVKEVQFINTNV